jgi:putative ubiquitin-RnfH superfamily antitoxin RatB of RatAB toxin-antitoxin module
MTALRAGLLPPDTRIDVDPAAAPLGVFGERVEDSYACQNGDRVEIYRPLQQDPMELRRKRARHST